MILNDEMLALIITNCLIWGWLCALYLLSKQISKAITLCATKDAERNETHEDLQPYPSGSVLAVKPNGYLTQESKASLERKCATCAHRSTGEGIDRVCGWVTIFNGQVIHCSEARAKKSLCGPKGRYWEWKGAK